VKEDGVWHEVSCKTHRQTGVAIPTCFGNVVLGAPCIGGPPWVPYYQVSPFSGGSPLLGLHPEMPTGSGRASLVGTCPPGGTL
jgi:hypothetical protein